MPAVDRLLRLIAASIALTLALGACLGTALAAERAVTSVLAQTSAHEAACKRGAENGSQHGHQLVAVSDSDTSPDDEITSPPEFVSFGSSTEPSQTHGSRQHSESGSTTLRSGMGARAPPRV